MRMRLVLAVIAMSLLINVPAQAQSPLEQARAAVAASTERLEAYLADLDATQQRGDELTAQYWQAESVVTLLDIQIEAAVHQTEDLAVEREALRAEVRDIALERYMTQSVEIGPGDHESEADRAAIETLVKLVIGVEVDATDRFRVVAEQHDMAIARLETQRAAQQERLNEVEVTATSVTAELERLAALRDDVIQELEELEEALADLEAAEAERAAQAAEARQIEADRARAEAAAAAAAELARLVPTPAPQPTATPQPTVTPQPTPTPTPTATAVPNPQLPEEEAIEVTPTPTSTAVPNPQLPEDVAPDPTATAVPTSVPNPQLPEDIAPDPTATAVPNPQPSVPLVPSGGGIVCPLAGAFTHTDDFNAPRAVGGVHRANDLMAPQGVPVLAVASGTVEHRSSSVGGMSVHLKGDNGDYYFYTHLSGYENVGAGHVQAGTVVGYVGMTGNAPIPHLHFEIHKGGYGNYANPYGPVRAACF